MDRLAPPGENLEDSAARAAIAYTLDEFLAQLDPDNPNATQLSAEQVTELMQQYVINYAFERFASEMGSRLEQDQVDLQRALDLQDQARGFIAAALKERLQDRAIDINSLATDKATQDRLSFELMQETFAILEDLE